MNDCQPLDNWIANYEADQRQKQQNFLRAVKYEFLTLSDLKERRFLRNSLAIVLKGAVKPPLHVQIH